MRPYGLLFLGMNGLGHKLSILNLPKLGSSYLGSPRVVFYYFRESGSVDGPVFWLPFPLLASGDPQNKKALEQEACRVGLLRFLESLNDAATMPSSPYKLWTLRPERESSPYMSHVPGFEVQSRPQPQSRRRTGTHKGGYQHAAFDGGSSARALPRLPP